MVLRVFKNDHFACARIDHIYPALRINVDPINTANLVYAIAQLAERRQIRTLIVKNLTIIQRGLETTKWRRTRSKAKADGNWTPSQRNSPRNARPG